jgi:hypothetical protein
VEALAVVRALVGVRMAQQAEAAVALVVIERQQGFQFHREQLMA